MKRRFLCRLETRKGASTRSFELKRSEGAYSAKPSAKIASGSYVAVRVYSSQSKEEGRKNKAFTPSALSAGDCFLKRSITPDTTRDKQGG